MNFEQVKAIRCATRATCEDMKSRQEKFGINWIHILNDLDLLVDLLNKHIAAFNIEMRGTKVKYWVNVNPIKQEFRNPYNYILITGKGTYFDRREVITFCDSGFIGFCGEADRENEKPILRAFGEWLALIKGGDE